MFIFGGSLWRGLSFYCTGSKWKSKLSWVFLLEEEFRESGVCVKGGLRARFRVSHKMELKCWIVCVVLGLSWTSRDKDVQCFNYAFYYKNKYTSKLISCGIRWKNSGVPHLKFYLFWFGQRFDIFWEKAPLI